MPQLKSPIDTLHLALASAAFVDLPFVPHFRRNPAVSMTAADWEEVEQLQRNPAGVPQDARGTWYYRRATIADITVVAMYAQMWGSSALGFCGIGSAAMTLAYTIVLSSPSGDRAVYFGGQFAYRIAPPVNVDDPKEIAFRADLAAGQLAHVAEAPGRYPFVDPLNATAS